MSVLIKTMTNLPEHCYECPCHDGESGYCQADKEHRYSDYRPFWCPLVEAEIINPYKECEAKAEKYKDCFQPKSNQQPLDEEIAKAFQLGMSFGFIDGLNANKNDIPLDELRAELEDYITHSPYIKSFMDCCRLRDDVMRIIDKYKNESEEDYGRKNNDI